MADKGIIFSAPMVRALLDGRKTQTRRLLKGVPAAPSQDSLVHQPRHDAPYFDAYCSKPKTTVNPRGMSHYWCWWTRDDREGRGIKVPYVPGQRLYVRESWRVSPDAAEGWHPVELRGWIDYQAGGSEEMVAPSMAAAERAAFVKGEDRDWDFVPSRYRPCIHMPRWASRLWLAVTDVRVQRLQECSEADAKAEGVDDTALAHFGCPLRAYRALWDHLHGGESDQGWLANPWVVAVSFDVHRGNIDAGGQGA